MSFGTSAYDQQACGAIDGICGDMITDEGLGLLQVKGNAVSNDGVSIEEQGALLDTNRKSIQETESELAILEEAMEDKIRFRAACKDWIDIVELYDDGFFQRFHSRDAGVWDVQGNTLVLKWLQSGNETLESKDEGRTFAGTGESSSFTLKSFAEPLWWRTKFTAMTAIFQDFMRSETAPPGHIDNMVGIVKKHINGDSADLDDKGYATLAALRDDHEMKQYISRVASQIGLRVVDQGRLEGVVPFYSGVKSVQSFAQLVKELKRTAKASTRKERWVEEVF